MHLPSGTSGTTIRTRFITINRTGPNDSHYYCYSLLVIYSLYRFSLAASQFPTIRSNIRVPSARVPRQSSLSLRPDGANRGYHKERTQPSMYFPADAILAYHRYKFPEPLRKAVRVLLDRKYSLGKTFGAALMTSFSLACGLLLAWANPRFRETLAIHGVQMDCWWRRIS